MSGFAKLLRAVFPEPAESSVAGPIDEIQYQLDVNEIGRNEYYSAAQKATRVVLAVSHRDPVEIEILGEPDNLRRYVDAEAIDILLDAGMSIKGERKHHSIGPVSLGTTSTELLDGRVHASPEVLSAVLDLYHPHMRHVHFLDKNGDAIARCYERAQSYWLTESEYSEVRDELDDEIVAALHPRNDS